MNLHIDLSDILAFGGLIITAVMLSQVSPWLVGALGGLVLCAIGLLRAR